MKVIYKKTIIEKINDAIAEANRSNKKIERFEFTRNEFNELTNSYFYEENIKWVASISGYKELLNGDITIVKTGGIVLGIDFVVIDEDI